MQKLSEIFEVRYGNSLELNRLTQRDANGISFVSRKMGDNGIAAYVEPIVGLEPNPAGELTCALSGNGVLSTFIQQRPYYTGFHVACLRPLIELSTKELLYYCVCIKSNRYRFSYGRQANRSLRELVLPSKEEIPGWISGVDVEHFLSADAAVECEPVSSLNTNLWHPFKLNEIFSLKKGKRLTKAKQSEGNIPFIGAVDNNNGITASVGNPPNHSADTITVTYNGSVAEAFWQTKPFWASDDVNVLYPKFEVNPYRAMFIIALIRSEKYRFNYGRKWHLERMSQSEIRLPVTEEGKPDWEFMENYIKTLPFSSQLSA